MRLFYLTSPTPSLTLLTRVGFLGIKLIKGAKKATVQDENDPGARAALPAVQRGF
jgi:hypothetical protein